MCLGTIRPLHSAVAVPVHRVPYRTSSPSDEILDPDLGLNPDPIGKTEAEKNKKA
jgi:hypothetical protein